MASNQYAPTRTAKAGDSFRYRGFLRELVLINKRLDSEVILDGNSHVCVSRGPVSRLVLCYYAKCFFSFIIAFHITL
ncbi:hypothetical protein L211DRAFT_168695 [Terfezia boudieri ATCC MYA-4762]|uniref:Uncharacterized protein n=1 Tax=Terfezia boudieri ATCC MYA-4762 TaxID=1051890 RepID=A0A3N4LNV2_9PEZI|nr:hypothetical protein L211DRAFT_168695 [Terfezia boudieri ATCC MYA-4762]